MQEVCHLGGVVLLSGGGTGGSKQADEREIDTVFSETQQIEDPQSPTAMNKQAMSTPTIKVNKTSGKGEGWKQKTSSTKRKAPAPPKNLQLQNRLIALKTEEEPSSTMVSFCGNLN